MSKFSSDVKCIDPYYTILNINIKPLLQQSRNEVQPKVEVENKTKRHNNQVIEVDLSKLKKHNQQHTQISLTQESTDNEFSLSPFILMNKSSTLPIFSALKSVILRECVSDISDMDSNYDDD